MEKELQGKVCLITGASGGIGKAAAAGLARMGARVAMVGRSPEKMAAAAQEIHQASGNPAVDCLIADLSSQAEIRRLAQEVKNRYPRLDVLINNAGATFLRRQLSVDGIEMTFALNHLGYFLLTNLLLDFLKSSAPARIINVASSFHLPVRLNFNDLQHQKGYFIALAYARTKLANLYFTYELARRLEGSRVTVNALHPGFVITNIGRNNGWPVSLAMRLVGLISIPPERGAETILYLAASPEVEGVSGKYFYRKQPVASSAVSYDREAARRLWEISAALSGLDE